MIASYAGLPTSSPAWTRSLASTPWHTERGAQIAGRLLSSVTPTPRPQVPSHPTQEAPPWTLTFSAVRFQTVTVWPIFSKLETMPLPMRPRPKNPILEKRDWSVQSGGWENRVGSWTLPSLLLLNLGSLTSVRHAHCRSVCGHHRRRASGRAGSVHFLHPARSEVLLSLHRHF